MRETALQSKKVVLVEDLLLSPSRSPILKESEPPPSRIRSGNWRSKSFAPFIISLSSSSRFAMGEEAVGNGGGGKSGLFKKDGRSVLRHDSKKMNYFPAVEEI